MAVSDRGDSRRTESSGSGDYVERTGRRNGIGVAALVVGVVALVLAVLIIFFPIAALLGLIAIILGIIGMSRASRGEADNRGQAIAGLVTGLLALAIAIFFTIGIGSFFVGHQDDFRKFGSCLTSADTKQQKTDCGQELNQQLDE
jgi:membrane-bound ClpP family serine protease